MMLLPSIANLSNGGGFHELDDNPKSYSTKPLPFTQYNSNRDLIVKSNKQELSYSYVKSNKQELSYI